VTHLQQRRQREQRGRPGPEGETLEHCGNGDADLHRDRKQVTQEPRQHARQAGSQERARDAAEETHAEHLDEVQAGDAPAAGAQATQDRDRLGLPAHQHVDRAGDGHAAQQHRDQRDEREKAGELLEPFAQPRLVLVERAQAEPLGGEWPAMAPQ
jgi:hypothetical protein